MYDSDTINIASGSTIVVINDGIEGYLAGILLAAEAHKTNVTVVDVTDDEKTAAMDEIGLWNDGVQELFHLTGFGQESLKDTLRPVVSTATHYSDWGEHDEFYLAEDLQDMYVTNTPFNRVSENIYRYREQYYKTAATQLAEGDRTIINEERHDPDDGPIPYYPYGGIAYSLADFRTYLENEIDRRAITLIEDDEVLDVEEENGYITYLETHDEIFHSDDIDFFVDGTGSDRAVIGEVTSEEPYGLPFDTALTVNVDRDITEIKPARELRTSEHGVAQRIDTLDARQWVYTYSSDHTDEDDAVEDFIELIDDSVTVTEDDVTVESYNAGYVPEPWSGNAIAVGRAHVDLGPVFNRNLSHIICDNHKIIHLLTNAFETPLKTTGSIYNMIGEDRAEKLFEHTALPLTYVNTDSDVWEDVRDSYDREDSVEYTAFTHDGVEMLDTELKIGDHLTDTQVDREEPAKDVPDTPTNPVTLRVLLALLGEEAVLYENTTHTPSDKLAEGVQNTTPGVEVLRERYYSYQDFYGIDGADDDDEDDGEEDSSEEDDEDRDSSEEETEDNEE